MLLQIVENQLADHPELKNATILIYSRFNSLSRKRIAKIIPEGEAQITENQNKKGFESRMIKWTPG